MRTSCRLTISDSFFVGNSAGGQGGAIYHNAKDAEIKNSVFIDNIGADYGGAITVGLGTLTLTNVFFSGNTSSAADNGYGGGALKVVGGTVKISGCTFTGNVATIGAYRNAICAYGHDGGSPVITFSGENYFGSTDYVFNNNYVYFDLTAGSRSTAQKAVISDYGVLYSNNGTGKYVVKISNATQSDSYLIAHNYNATTASTMHTSTIYIKGGTGSEQSLAINEGGVSNSRTVDGFTCYAEVTDNGDLYIHVDNLIFVNKDWTDGANVTVSYNGSTFSGVCGTGKFYNNYNAATSASATSGQKIVGVSESDKSIQLKSATTEITDGTFTKLIVGGTVASADAVATKGAKITLTGGNYSCNVVAGDYTNGSANVTENGNINLVITGGVYNMAIAGGMYAYSTTGKAILSGSVDMTISGGVFNARIYGGNYAKNDKSGTAENSCIVGGSIAMTVDCARATQINDGITLGSRGTSKVGMVLGGTSITFRGDGTSNLSFGEGVQVWGGCTKDSRRYFADGAVREIKSAVTGSRSLIFDSFQHTGFSADVGLFTDIEVKNGSNVVFTNEDLYLGEVKNWTIEKDCSLAGLLGNDFDEDVLKLYGKAGDTLISGNKDTFFNFDKASEVYLNDVACVWDSTNKAWYAGSINLKLSVTDDFKLQIASPKPFPA